MQPRVPLLAASIALAASVASCVPHDETSHLAAGRAKTYSSLGELEADSAVIVIGTVTEQGVVKDVEVSLDNTLSTVEVQSARKSEVPSRIVVRQTGSTIQGAPVPILESGGQYLLYLVPSGLEGDAADQFYVTGLDDGIYRAAHAERPGAQPHPISFVRAHTEPDDHLPERIVIDDD